MKPTLVIRPLALAEAAAAQDFIEHERPGHGNLFQQDLDAMIEEIVRQPNRFPYAEGDKDIRQAILDRFAYSIYYRVRPGRIIVVGVYHHSRDPDGWKNRR